MNYEDIRNNPDLLKPYKYKDMITLTCCKCQQEYQKTKHDIRKNMRNGDKNYCSNNCRFESQITKQEVTCLQCNIKFFKQKSQIKKHPNHFCCHSCAATYNNTHKTTGTRRSKLETWLENKLIELYPNLEILFNDKTTIKSELDIYIPSLKLAFELNGIFHYEPIYGEEQLNKILNNDTRKFMLCQQHGIGLCIIDTTSQKRFTEQSSQKFLDIIVKIIQQNQ